MGTPEAVGKESGLYAPYNGNLEGVLKHGNLKRTRDVLASHSVKAFHEEGIDNAELKSLPDSMFQGRNPVAFLLSDANFVPDDYEKKWAFTTAKHRGLDISGFLDAPKPTSHDRIFSRTTLEAYRGPIDKFETRLQLLYAFRNAIAGHQNLWRKGILHRDISINIILLGKEDAEPGYRGLVIDLDMAICINRTTSFAGADFRTVIFSRPHNFRII